MKNKNWDKTVKGHARKALFFTLILHLGFIGFITSSGDISSHLEVLKEKVGLKNDHELLDRQARLEQAKANLQRKKKKGRP